MQEIFTSDKSALFTFRDHTMHKNNKPTKYALHWGIAASGGDIRLNLILIAKSQQVVLRIGYLCLFSARHRVVVVPGKIVYLLLSSFYARPPSEQLLLSSLYAHSVVCIVIKAVINHKLCWGDSSSSSRSMSYYKQSTTHTSRKSIPTENIADLSKLNW